MVFGADQDNALRRVRQRTPTRISPRINSSAYHLTPQNTNNQRNRGPQQFTRARALVDSFSTARVGLRTGSHADDLPCVPV